MLIISGKSRRESRESLAGLFSQPRLPVHLAIHRSQVSLSSLPWREYWRSDGRFFGVDLRLVQRLNRLKSAWLGVLRHPADRVTQMTYCWRYFGLLHHAMRIARDEPWRPDPLSAIRRIVGFESFVAEAAGEVGAAACTITTRNPAFLLGQLAADPMIPTPRHVPLLMPPGTSDVFYHYRQVLVSGTPAQSILVDPAVSLRDRPASFLPIDRLTRLISERPDPYWKPRAKLLARRLLLPLLQAWSDSASAATAPLSVLDLGAGTGHLVAKAWTYLGRMSRHPLPPAALHFVDSSPPAFGRSFGLTRDRAGVTHVEWTTGDYRALVDDDGWLRRSGAFDWVFACRVLDNTSNFLIEQISEAAEGFGMPDSTCLPHRCLAPRWQPHGIRQLMVSPARRPAHGGTILPQFSLSDYFAAMLAIQNGAMEATRPDAWYLPVRRFNPASLITPSGRSLVAQLMKAARSVIIEDVDVEPEHLMQHHAQFGLPGTAAVFCTRDGFNTEAKHYIITSPGWAAHISGERLW